MASGFTFQIFYLHQQNPLNIFDKKYFLATKDSYKNKTFNKICIIKDIA